MGYRNLKSLSVFISLILRHKPEAAGISLDEHGWADIEKLLAGMNASGHRIDREMLEEIVRTDEKGRYSLSGDGAKIRANQGHSVPVDVELSPAQPPEILYHGTAERFAYAIREGGLLPMGRLYVHLSKDVESGRMYRDGIPFYLSCNGVWLTKAVKPGYLKGRE